MKKIISMGIASAVLAMTAVSAFAEVEPVTLPAPFSIATDDENAAKDDTVTFTVTSNVAINTEVSYKVVVVGLEYDDSDLDVGTFDNNTATGTVDGSGTEISADTLIATFSYTVTGDVGDTVTFKVTADDDDSWETESLSIKVVDDNTDSGSGDESNDDESSDDESNDDESSDDESNDDESSDGEGSGEDDGDNPITGVTLAVIPAVMVGAAIVVAAKKRK